MIKLNYNCLFSNRIIVLSFLNKLEKMKLQMFLVSSIVICLSIELPYFIVGNPPNKFDDNPNGFSNNSCRSMKLSQNNVGRLNKNKMIEVYNKNTYEKIGFS